MMTMGKTIVLLAMVFIVMASTTTAFMVLPHRQTTRSPTVVVTNMIDKNIADMIDQEYYRQHHKEEYYQQWMVRHQPQVQRSTVVGPVPDDTIGVTTTIGRDTYHPDIDNDDDTVLLNRRQFLRDEKLARTNPQQYCMDRCIATGYCDVYED